MQEICIRLLTTADLHPAAEILTQLNPETPAAIIATRLETILAEHGTYQIFGAFAGETLAGVAGAWIGTKIWCGRYLEIDNLVVAAEQRSSGLGSRLIQHLEALAVERDCKVVVMDSYAANRPSHRLYHRLGYEIWGFHFIKPIGDWQGS
jgi:ribosomal protein S18 acetylase RimI-like enzyme